MYARLKKIQLKGIAEIQKHFGNTLAIKTKITNKQKMIKDPNVRFQKQLEVHAKDMKIIFVKELQYFAMKFEGKQNLFAQIHHYLPIINAIH
jgi:hypothetical protein